MKIDWQAAWVAIKWMVLPVGVIWGGAAILKFAGDYQSLILGAVGFMAYVTCIVAIYQGEARRNREKPVEKNMIWVEYQLSHMREIIVSDMETSYKVIELYETCNGLKGTNGEIESIKIKDGYFNKVNERVVK